MDKLLTLITVCICCISIFGLKVRLDVYVHDKNEVITTMEPDKNSGYIDPPISKTEASPKETDDKGIIDSIVEWWHTPRNAAAKAREEANKPKWYGSKAELWKDLNAQIVANKKIKYRTRADDESLFRLIQAQNDILYGERRRQFGRDLRDKYNASDAKGDTFRGTIQRYVNEGGISKDTLDGILTNIIQYITPLLSKQKGVLDPSNISNGTRERLKGFLEKVYNIYLSTEPIENKIAQFNEVLNDPDFDEFYGNARRLSRGHVRELTGIGISDKLDPTGYYLKDYDAYLEGIKAAEAISIDPNTNNPNLSTQQPLDTKSIDNLLGRKTPNNPNNQGNQGEGQQGDPNNPDDQGPVDDGGVDVGIDGGDGGVDAYPPEGQGAPTRMSNDSNTILNNALSSAGPMHALNATPGLTEEKYIALRDALRKYALENGIVTDTPKDPNSFKPYIPKYYI